jgi:hypothetical protein
MNLAHICSILATMSKKFNWRKGFKIELEGCDYRRGRG